MAAMRRIHPWVCTLLTLAAPALPGAARSQAAPPAAYSDASEAAYQTALDAYLYLYPLVVMDLTRRQLTNVNAGAGKGRAAPNTFAAPDTPQDGMLESAAWVDLQNGPMVLHVPATQGRYYVLDMVDMWRDVIAVVGKPTTGTDAADFLLVPPNWVGVLPTGMQRIEATTPQLWLQNTVQTFGAGDAEAARAVLAGFQIRVAGDSGGGPQSMQIRSDPGINMVSTPVEQADRMGAETFYNYAADIWRRNPAHATDQPIAARLARLGIAPGRRQEFSELDPYRQHALRRAVAMGRELVAQDLPDAPPTANGWRREANTQATWGNDYLNRARAVRTGRGNGTREERLSARLLVDGAGNALNGSGAYVLHFAADALPATRIGWSLGVYRQVDGAASGARLGDRDPLAFNPDGSLDIYLSGSNSVAENAHNWLALPDGAIFLRMRIHAPYRAADAGLDPSGIGALPTAMPAP
jgi:hypothetical protein